MVTPMTNQEVAKFHNISLGGFKHWTPEQRRRARIEAEVEADAVIQKQIAELNRLAYVFDCKHVNGIEQVMECRINRNTFRQLSVSIYQGVKEVRTITIDLKKYDVDPKSVIANLSNARAFLQELIYGAPTNAR